MLIGFVIAILEIVAMWTIFTKAGEKGWKSIVPIYNVYMLYKITWGNGWYFLATLIPGVNIVMVIITMVKLANAFDQGTGFAIGLILLNPIFVILLAFSNAEYVGI
ncbi:DUF5684 domain-containing protein [Anaerosporobacter sp.]|uniref:DUF5684 domain-containing protein n=1 Tax=Anaerosporobacter sp. TaxID=1872529 RepID=UPI00286ECA08|nr:DUF5684 domain-containing protein [Anaerosporobacter sp.]